MCGITPLTPETTWNTLIHLSGPFSAFFCLTPSRGQHDSSHATIIVLYIHAHFLVL